MGQRLEGRIALVTGATAGIGRATAELLAERGAHLIISARGAAALDELAGHLTSEHGVSVHPVTADLTGHDGVDVVVQAVQSAGRLDILVNNAGRAEQHDEELGEELWRHQLELNFHSKRRLAESLLPLLRTSPAGRVVNLVGILEPAVVSAAQASVAACVTWSKALSRECGPFGVTVNCVAPGRIDSDQLRRLMPDDAQLAEFARTAIPLQRIGTAREAAQLIAFLVSDEASYITGQRISVDGGLQRGI